MRKYIITVNGFSRAFIIGGYSDSMQEHLDLMEVAQNDFPESKLMPNDFTVGKVRNSGIFDRHICLSFKVEPLLTKEGYHNRDNYFFDY